MTKTYQVEVDGLAPVSATGKPDLVRAMKQLEVPGRDFLVVSRADEDYAQAYQHSPDGWQVEYREGSADRHYQTLEHQSREQAERLLWGWISDTPEWQGEADWRRLTPEDLAGSDEE
ncbi:hypothetical protein [Streptomyces sp. NRRL WC-3742]|uniref:hypothetical protein n=1 Tax=Streptomyces sp. NRRL WC-3742 TaxID=1463934 RepID=UPI0004CC6A9F|nr:hypothetical protein [Streptomyces sp. NRRL WC-3742]